MSTTVTISDDDLPDATATLHDDGSYEFSITGLAGLAERPRAPSRAELDAGILSSDPPTIRTSDIRKAEILMLRAVELALPDGLLDNVEDETGAVIDKESLLLAQLTRIIRRVTWVLEPPT
jgi:hypothetical protein